MKEPIRIISDLHLGHPASLARDIEQIEPLFRGARTVIFNGDTVEMRSVRNREKAVRIMAEVEEFCAAQSAQTRFINGNHDPIISTLNHLEIGEGRMLVTHGDSLFPGEPEDDAYDESAVITDFTAADLKRLEKILSTNKRGSLTAIENDHFTIPNGAWGQVSTFVKQTWPPRNLARMVSGWRNSPLQAVNLVRLYHPTARCVVVGHTHRPGVWHRHGYTVLNTGSFLPMLGRLAVDYADGVISVRKILFRKKRFHLGRLVTRFRAADRLRSA